MRPIRNAQDLIAAWEQGDERGVRHALEQFNRTRKYDRPMNNSTLTKVIEVAAKLTGRRYCSHHRSEVDANAGGMVLKGKTRRFICFTCQEKSAKRAGEIANERRALGEK
jgi:hypothetical protein